MSIIQFIVAFIRRYTTPLALACFGFLAWQVTSYMFEGTQSVVGPDFLARLPVKLITVASALLITRLIIWFMFPTIYNYTDTRGGHRKSKFAAEWDDFTNNNVPRLWLCVLTYLGTLLIVSQLLLSS